MFTRTVTLLFALLLAAPGCDEKAFDPADLTDEGVSSGGDDSGAAGSEASLMKEDDGELPPEALLACELDLACGQPLELGRDDPATAYEPTDECVLKHFAGGSRALIQTVTIFPDAEAYLDHVVDVDGSLLRQGHGWADGLGIWQREVERCALAEPAFFAGCLERFDADCLDPERWIVAGSCAPLGSLVCPAP